MKSKKILTKILSITLVCVMLVMCMGAGYSGEYNVNCMDNAARGAEDDFNENDYDYLTFSSSANEVLAESDCIMSKNNLQVQTSEEIIDDAIEFVYSLNLPDAGFQYLEKECVLQLEGYKEIDVRLESYSVLVPKSNSYIYYGTSASTDYYYNYISVANYHVETIGNTKGSNQVDWGKWVMGAINIAMCFADVSISIPFTIISTVIGAADNSQMESAAHNKYVTRFNNVQTKVIYRGGSTTHPGNVCFRAEKGNTNVELYFYSDLIAQQAYTFIETIYNGLVDRADFFTKEYLLSYFTYTNITGEIMDLPLGAIGFSEKWN